MNPPLEPVIMGWLSEQAAYGLPQFGHSGCMFHVRALQDVTLLSNDGEPIQTRCTICGQALVNSDPHVLSPLAEQIAQWTLALARQVMLHHTYIQHSWGDARLAGKTYRALADQEWLRAQTSLFLLHSQAAATPGVVYQHDLDLVLNCAQGMQIRLGQFFLEPSDDTRSSEWEAHQALASQLWQTINQLAARLHEQASQAGTPLQAAQAFFEELQAPHAGLSQGIMVTGDGLRALQNPAFLVQSDATHINQLIEQLVQRIPELASLASYQRWQTVRIRWREHAACEQEQPHQPTAHLRAVAVVIVAQARMLAALPPDQRPADPLAAAIEHMRAPSSGQAPMLLSHHFSADPEQPAIPHLWEEASKLSPADWQLITDLATLDFFTGEG